MTDTFRYDVWGDIAERMGNTPTPHQFVGALGYEREADSGLIFIGTRYYDPSVGRFISQDAAQWGVNWYAYAANNPVNAFDANGNIPVPLITGAIGAIGGAIIGGVGAYINGGNVWAGIGRGALVGGIAGATGGWIGGIVGGAVSGGAGIAAGVGGGMVAGAAEGVVGDIAAQAVCNVMGWQDGWNWGQTIGSGAIGAVTGGIGGYIGAVGKGRPFSELMTPEEAARYQRYWEKHAPVQSRPYDVYPRYNPDGTLHQITTYDEFGRRAFQYDFDPTPYHGPNYHEFRYSNVFPDGHRIEVGPLR